MSNSRNAVYALYEFIHVHDIYGVLRRCVIDSFHEMNGDDVPKWNDDMPDVLMEEIPALAKHYPTDELSQAVLLEYAEQLAEEYHRERMDDARNFPVGWRGDEY
ncbi:MAG: hypothetical protein GX878_11520 [Firmicutes bacterium]|nr:hypothetical protein [Bacillota bacterium]